jgi:hypothetical protein
MMLKSFGCSFVFGSDLPDDDRSGKYASYSRMTWPSLLADKLNMQYCCYARPGSGNLRILEQVLTHAASNEQDFFVIGWSWIDRFDYQLGNQLDQKKEVWKTILPVDETEQARLYYRDLHSEYVDKLNTLTRIRTAVDVLEQKRIPFLMTYMDTLMFDRTWHATPAVTDAQDRIRPYMTLFDDETFLAWSRKNGFEISPTLHPLETAHRTAADLILPIAQQKLQNFQSTVV